MEYKMCTLVRECPDDPQRAREHWEYWKGIALSGGVYGVPTISEMNEFREMQIAGELILNSWDGKFSTMHGGD